MLVLFPLFYKKVNIFNDYSMLQYIIYQILQGLSVLHNHKLIHRDIKPSNICINNVGQFKLSDFGITTHTNHHLLCSSFVGTNTYMSPERINGTSYSYIS